MVLKKRLLTIFYLVLRDSRVDNLTEGRYRDAIAKNVFNALHDFEESRKKIYEEFTKKDTEGKPLLKDGNYQFDPKVGPEMVKEVQILEDEDCEVAMTNSDKLKKLIENTKYEPKVGETEVIDELIACIK